MRVLLVDDNQDAGVVLSHLLAHVGHEIRVAVNGREALQLAVDFRPDTVLLDIRLPDMDGYEVARRLRDLRLPIPARVVVLSGINPDPQRDREAGIDCHLVKPAPLADVLRTMQTEQPIS